TGGPMARGFRVAGVGEVRFACRVSLGSIPSRACVRSFLAVSSWWRSPLRRFTPPAGGMLIRRIETMHQRRKGGASMTVGPLELVVLGFEGDSFKGHIAAELDKVVKRDIINLVDLVFVRKDREGEVTVSEIQDLRDTDAKRYAGIVGDVMGLLTDEDLSKVGDELEPATAAAVIL